MIETTSTFRKDKGYSLNHIIFVLAIAWLYMDASMVILAK